MLAAPARVDTDADSISSKSSSVSRSKIGNVLISGVGFLADAYDLFVIDLVVAILVATNHSQVTPGDKSLIVSSTLAGAVLGQLFFGLAADYVGRRIMFVTTAFLIIFGSISSSLVGWGYATSTPSFTIFHQLAICRFVIGFGIGGEYPLSATVASENETREELLQNSVSNYKGCFWYLSHKPNSIVAVFSMQGVGMLLSPLLVMACVASGLSLELTWRICLSAGAIPSAIAFYYRWEMSETAAFQQAQIDLHATESHLSLSKSSDSKKASVSATKESPEATTAASAIVSSGRDEHPVKSLDAFETPTAPEWPISMSLEETTGPQGVSSPLDFETALATGNMVPKQQGPLGSEKQPKAPSTSSAATARESKAASSSSELDPSPTLLKSLHRGLTAKKDVKSFANHVRRSLQIIKSLKYVIIGTSVTWFLIDVTLYGTGSFKTAVVGNWFLGSPDDAQVDARRVLETVDVSVDDLPSVSSSDTKTLPHSSPIKSLSSRSSLVARRPLLLKLLTYDRHSASESIERRRRLASESDVPLGESQVTRDDIMTQAGLAAIVALLSIPGYILSLLFVHNIGTKRLQFWGFIATGVVFMVLGIEQLVTQDKQGYPILELILFGLTFMASNFGPNTTTFIIPTQVYPTILRASCHGFSAAMGKLGGVFGTSLFSIIEKSLGLGWLLVMCGAVAFLGSAFTRLIPNDLKYTKQSLYRKFAPEIV